MTKTVPHTRVIREKYEEGIYYVIVCSLGHEINVKPGSRLEHVLDNVHYKQLGDIFLSHETCTMCMEEDRPLEGDEYLPYNAILIYDPDIIIEKARVAGRYVYCVDKEL